MHAPVGMRRGFMPRDEANHFVMSDFALGNDHAMMLQGRGKSKTYPAGFSSDSGPVLQGGGTGNNDVYGDSRTADVASYGKGGFSDAQIQKNDVAVPMSAEARLFSADEYAGMSNVSDVICSPGGGTVRTQDEHKNKGSDMFLLDWPELGPLEDFETDLRFGDAKDLQLTINMSNPTNTQQPSRNGGRETPLNSSSSEEIDHFPPLSEADLFCPFDDMLVPTSSSIMCSSSTLSGPDNLVAAYVPPCSTKKKPHATTPDMILDEMAENPLEMYFPPLTTYEQLAEMPMSGTSSIQMHRQLLPEGYFAGDAAALDGAGLEFGPKGRRTGLRESIGSSSIVKAAPVKHAGFQKLQEGMNQLDVGAKTCIRDALYRMANSVERRHADLTVGSSGAANRLKTSSAWTKTEGGPMDRSVAQLLLQKPPYRKTTDCQANGVAS